MISPIPCPANSTPSGTGPPPPGPPSNSPTHLQHCECLLLQADSGRPTCWHRHSCWLTTHIHRTIRTRVQLRLYGPTRQQAAGMLAGCHDFAVRVLLSCVPVTLAAWVVVTAAATAVCLVILCRKAVGMGREYSHGSASLTSLASIWMCVAASSYLPSAVRKAVKMQVSLTGSWGRNTTLWYF